MQIYFMKQDALNYFKVNMGRLYINYFQKDDVSWMTEEWGKEPFVPFMEVPEFEMTSLLDNKTAGEIDLENCKIIYENLKSLSESQASDERLWAGLCNKTFYKYMRRRHGYTTASLKDKEKDASGILSRFFFSGGTRAGFYRNTIAKCWWVGRATYDKGNMVNHFEMLDDLGSNDLSTKVSDIFYSNTFASNPTILKGICSAFRFYSDHGIKLRMREEIRPALQYLNAVGGATLLDVLSEEEIKKLMVKRISELLKGDATDFRVEFNDANELEDVADEIKIDTSNDLVTNLRENVTKEASEVLHSYEPLDANIENEGDLLDKPEFVTWGCYMKVRKAKDDKIITYHLPLESDKSRELWLIERKLLGKQVGHRIYLSGAWYELLEFGWEEDYAAKNVNTIKKTKG
mgnify:CR=1 FL=1